MGPVKHAVRATLPTGSAMVETLSEGAPFELDRVDDAGIRVRLGRKRTPTRLSWACLEGVVPFLRGRGWVAAGGKNDVRGEAGKLDEHLKTPGLCKEKPLQYVE